MFAEFLKSFVAGLSSTAASRVGLCSCGCHISGRYGGVTCPPHCSSWGKKFDGCHSCGCPGTACPLGECYTNPSTLRPDQTHPGPAFDPADLLRWKKQPTKLARIAAVHFGAYEVVLLDAIYSAGRSPGYKFVAPFGAVEDWLEKRT